MQESKKMPRAFARGGIRIANGLSDGGLWKSISSSPYTWLFFKPFFSGHF
jgi:hypothetical protein